MLVVARTSTTMSWAGRPASHNSRTRRARRRASASRHAVERATGSPSASSSQPSLTVIRSSTGPSASGASSGSRGLSGAERRIGLQEGEGLELEIGEAEHRASGLALGVAVAEGGVENPQPLIDGEQLPIEARSAQRVESLAVAVGGGRLQRIAVAARES